MDESSIAGRTEKLRREIALIEQEERRYRNNMRPSREEKAEDDKRRLRILAIREELRTLVEKQRKNQTTDQSGTVEFFSLQRR